MTKILKMNSFADREESVLDHEFLETELSFFDFVKDHFLDNQCNDEEDWDNYLVNVDEGEELADDSEWGSIVYYKSDGEFIIRFENGILKFVELK